MLSKLFITKAFANHLCKRSTFNILPRFATTRTVALDNEKIYEVNVETTIQPYISSCTPSTQEKIYPTRFDDYESIPVVVDGIEHTIKRIDLYNPYPIIPTLEIVGSDEDNKESDITVTELMNVEFPENMPTILDDKKPERDLVNFPPYEQVIKPPSYRLYFLPENWFTSFYTKTGVTGPYLLLAGLSTFLLSKEWLVIEHSAVYGSVFVSILVGMNYKYGKKIERLFAAAMLKERQGWADWQEGSIKFLQNYIKMRKDLISWEQNKKIIFDAKRENIHFQREAEYRKRLMTVYNEAMKKLNYQIALDTAKDQFSRRYMANWIINNVYKNITPQQKKFSLDQAISDLKILASKRENSI